MLEQIKRLLAPPVFPGDEEKTNTASLLNVILITIFLVTFFTIGSLTLVQTLQPEVRNTGLILAAMTLVIWVIMRQGYVRPAAVMLATLILAGSAVILYQNGSVRDPFKPALLVSIIIAALFVGDVASYVFAGLSIATVVVLFEMEKAGMLPPFEWNLRPGQWIDFIAVAFVTAVLLQLTNRSRRRRMIQLREANSALEETGRRLRERTNDLELTADIGRNLSQVRDLDQLLPYAADLIQDRFHLYHVQIYLADRQQRNLVLRAGTGETGETLVRRGHTLPIAPGSLNGAAAAGGGAVIVENTSNSTTFRPNPLLPETKSEMAVPLLFGNTVLGVLNLQNNVKRSLTTETLPTFETVANQLAVAIENANLLREAEIAREEVENSARQLTRERWTGFLDGIHRPEKVGFSFDRQGLQPLSADAGLPQDDEDALRVPLILANEPIGQIRVKMGGDRSWAEEEIMLATAVANEVAQQVENLRLLAEAEQYRRESEEALRRLRREAWQEYAADHPETVQGYVYNRQQVQPLTAVSGNDDIEIRQPLQVQDQVFGELAVSGSPEDEAVIELVQNVAARLSNHLESLRLSEQTEKALAQTADQSRRLALLNEASSKLSAAADQDEIIQIAVTYASHLFETPGATLALLNQTTRKLEIYAMDEKTGQATKINEIPADREGATIATAVQSGELVYVPDLQEGGHPNAAQLVAAGFHSSLLAPLATRRGPLGTINVSSRKVNAFAAEQQQNLMVQFAALLAATLDERRLLNEAQTQAEKERVVNEISQRIQSTLTMEEALQTAVFELGQALRAQNTQIELLTVDETRPNGS